MKNLLESKTIVSISRGGGVVIALASKSQFRDKKGYEKDKQASEPLARRGSSPFPGAEKYFERQI